MGLIKTSFLFFFTPFLAAAALEYRIAPGDSLPLIIKKTGCNQNLLKRCNPDYDLMKLQTDDILYYPRQYIVQQGDTFYSLSRRWNIRVEDIQTWNQLGLGEVLKQGTLLFIPFKVPEKASWDHFWPVKATPQKEIGSLQAVTFDAKGQEFHSVCDGVVVYKGELKEIGLFILIENKEKLTFAFGNFQSSVIEFGQSVIKGQVLGTTGSNPRQRLYFFVFREGEALDPFKSRR